MIQTRIIGLEGEHADHLTAALIQYFYVLNVAGQK